MANLENSVCLNHPHVPALARCAVCGKPVCVQCVIKDGGTTYCSQECRADAIRTGQKVERVQKSKTRANHKRLIRKVIWLIMLAAAAVAGYWYYSTNKHTVKAKLQDGMHVVETLRNKAKQEIQKSLPKQKDFR